jgi:hypothetical protein
MFEEICLMLATYIVVSACLFMKGDLMIGPTWMIGMSISESMLYILTRSIPVYVILKTILVLQVVIIDAFL